MTHLYKVTILAGAVEVAFRSADMPESLQSGSSQPPETIRLAWARKPAVAAKGVAVAPSNGSPVEPKTRDAALAAIGKARLWLKEILAGGSLTAIARREGKGERQIRLLLPLAFMPPATVRGLIDGTASASGVTEMVRSVPVIR